MRRGHKCYDPHVDRVVIGEAATLDITPCADVTVARVGGDVDLASTRELRAEILGALDALRPRVVVLDLTDVAFLDSSGLRLLFELGRRFSRLRARLAVVLPRDEHVREVFAIVDAAHALRLFESVDDALANRSRVA